MLGFTAPVHPPALPVQLVQATAKSGPVTNDINKTITFCRDTQSLTPESALNSFSPISVEFLRQIGAKHGGTLTELKPYKATLVKPPQHGQVYLLDEGSHHWSYIPPEGYTGVDQVIYLVEKQGSRYTVIVNFWVLPAIDENLKPPVCKSIKFSEITQNNSDTTLTTHTYTSTL